MSECADSLRTSRESLAESGRWFPFLVEALSAYCTPRPWPGRSRGLVAVWCRCGRHLWGETVGLLTAGGTCVGKEPCLPAHPPVLFSL